jgi:hypothetical protein
MITATAEETARLTGVKGFLRLSIIRLWFCALVFFWIGLGHGLVWIGLGHGLVGSLAGAGLGSLSAAAAYKLERKDPLGVTLAIWQAGLTFSIVWSAYFVVSRRVQRTYFPDVTAKAQDVEHDPAQRRSWEA